MTGSALRLEESRDGRMLAQRDLSTGGGLEGDRAALPRDREPGGFPKRAFRLRHPLQIVKLGVVS